MEWDGTQNAHVMKLNAMTGHDMARNKIHNTIEREIACRESHDIKLKWYAIGFHNVQTAWQRNQIARPRTNIA